MSEVIAFVPARCGSKSIPLKNIKPLAGKPLLFYVLHALQQAPSVEEIYVATDCDTIELCVTQLNFSKVKIYRRLPDNATDTASTESVMLEFLHHNPLPDHCVFILAQATSPFTQPKHIEEALVLFNTHRFDSLLSCSRWKRFLWNEDGSPKNYDFRHRPRRQDMKGELAENGAFYISTVKNILLHKNRLSGKIGIYEMPEICLLELDEPLDWLIAENILSSSVNADTTANPDTSA